MKLGIKVLALIATLAVLAGCTGRTESCQPDGYTFPPCATEDSDNCYWDGGSNGQGRKFVSINGEVSYLS